jgi:hypothetical protein
MERIEFMDVVVETNPQPSVKPLGLLGRDEMNLAEFPITLLTRRVPKDQKEAVYQDEIFDERTGRTLARKLTIQAGNYGLTTANDDEVIIALIQLTKQNSNFTKRKVTFTRLELIKLLGWPTHGASYDRILLSLQKWTSVYLQYENAWRDNRSKAWTTKGFHIIEAFELNDSRNSGEQFDLIPSYIIWGEDIFESFQAGYLKPLDYDLCMGLSNSTAKRMYRFLDKRFYHSPDWTFDLKELAHEHIGLGRHYEGPAHLKRNLMPAIKELESVGFLEPLSQSERFPNEGTSWRVRLTQKLPASPPLAVPDDDVKAEPPPLVAELTKRDVTQATAEALVRQYPTEEIAAKLEVFDWLVEKQDKRVAKSPAGYLVMSIQKDYATPKGFVSKAERQRSEAARQAKERQAAEERRRKQAEERRQDEERKAADAEIERLTPLERAELEAEVLAEADPEERQAYEDPSLRMFRDTLMLGMLRNRFAEKRRADQVPAEA